MRRVRIYCQPGVERGDRVWLSAGTEQRDQVLPGHPPYAAGAFRPRGPWRQPAPRELAQLFTDERDVDPAETVGVLAIPDELLAPLRALGVDRVERYTDLRRVGSHPDYPAAVAPLRAFLAAHRRAPGELTWHPLCGARGHLQTVTPQPQPTLRLIGLHVDHFEGVPLGRLAEARNRICVNLGRGHRYFLFVPVPVDTLAEDPAAAGPDGPPGPGGSNKRPVLERFLSAHPDHPVVRLRLAPGEAYVAPTENLIHDGSTEGRPWFDVNLTVRGRFGFERRPG